MCYPLCEGKSEYVVHTSSQEHIIMDTNGSWNDAAKAHARKDVAIIGLHNTFTSGVHLIGEQIQLTVRTFNLRPLKPYMRYERHQFCINCTQVKLLKNSQPVIRSWQNPHICDLLILLLTEVHRIPLVTRYMGMHIGMILYLANHVSLSLISDRWKRASAGKDALSLIIKSRNCQNLSTPIVFGL